MKDNIWPIEKDLHSLSIFLSIYDPSIPGVPIAERSILVTLKLENIAYFDFIG